MRVVQMEPGPCRLDGVRAAISEILDARRARNVAGNDGQFGKRIAQHAHGVAHARLWPCAVETATTSTPRSTSAPTWFKMRSRSNSPKALRVAETARHK